MRDLPTVLNAFDIGVFLLEPVNLHYRLALPNKLFEFIQGRLGVAIGPSPEMARVVREAGCGVIAPDFRPERLAPDFRPESLAACLNDLGEREINAFKERSHTAARQLCAERNEPIFAELVERILLKRRVQAA
jgi:hypothetical protein